MGWWSEFGSRSELPTRWWIIVFVQGLLQPLSWLGPATARRNIPPEWDWLLLGCTEHHSSPTHTQREACMHFLMCLSRWKPYAKDMGLVGLVLNTEFMISGMTLISLSNFFCKRFLVRNILSFSLLTLCWQLQLEWAMSWLTEGLYLQVLTPGFFLRWSLLLLHIWQQELLLHSTCLHFSFSLFLCVQLCHSLLGFSRI